MSEQQAPIVFAIDHDSHGNAMPTVHLLGDHDAVRAVIQLREHRDDLEVKLAKVPALVEALTALRDGSWAVGMPEYVDNPRAFARDALKAWEAE
jgi:hypothetical protein